MYKVGKKMLKRSRVWLLATFAMALITLAPASAIFAGQGQTPESLVAEKMIDFAQNARLQVNSLIDSVYVDEETLQKIADADLTIQLEGNVTLYDQGVILLAQAETSFENKDYGTAIISTQEAMQTFRQVFKSINLILIGAGLETGNEFDAPSLLDAANRTLNRIARLRELLPSDATNEAALLDEAEALLNLEKIESLILEGKTSLVADNLRTANELVSQVYQYLKLQAEEFNTVRIRGYLGDMEQERERLRERLQYAGSLGISVDGILQSLGYHNETEFMNAIQSMVQNAESQMGNLTGIMGDLEALGQLVQQMNQTLTQVMNRYQGQHGQGGSGSQSSGTGSGPAATESGYGSDSVGTSSSGAGSGLGGNGTASVEGQSGYGPGTGGNSPGSSGAATSGTSSEGTESGLTGDTGSPSGTSGLDGNSGVTSDGDGCLGPGTTGTESGNSMSGTGGKGS
jgi:hypothetical protein